MGYFPVRDYMQSVGSDCDPVAAKLQSLGVAVTGRFFGDVEYGYDAGERVDSGDYVCRLQLEIRTLLVQIVPVHVQLDLRLFNMDFSSDCY